MGELIVRQQVKGFTRQRGNKLPKERQKKDRVMEIRRQKKKDKIIGIEAVIRTMSNTIKKKTISLLITEYGNSLFQLLQGCPLNFCLFFISGC